MLSFCQPGGVHFFEQPEWCMCGAQEGNIILKRSAFEALEADLAQAQARANALAVEHAELLAAADALATPFPSTPGQRLAACRICRATWRIGQPERHQDIEYGVPCPVVAYRRLRGGRAPEGEP